MSAAGSRPSYLIAVAVGYIQPVFCWIEIAMTDLGVRRWLISCDESGIHGSPHYGFGSLWMRWQRRGDFISDFRELTKKHRFEQECKWSHASAKSFLPFYSELISYFFQRRWLVFHCLVVRKQVVEKAEYHQNSWESSSAKALYNVADTENEARPKKVSKPPA
ncbi:MAG TPA: hypothetical protein VGO68_03070 [Pyrinomonadaceae bacterium]|jgi:hypothetical protein|nr:hypothetical protein [Pyrinomonadaceae bacterium]